MKHLANNINGFTLIEILFSVVILSIGILGLASISTSVIHGNSISGNSTKALVLIQDKLEEIITLDFNDSQLTDDGVTGDLSDGITVTSTDGTQTTLTPDHINGSPSTVNSSSATVVNTPIDSAGNTGQAESTYQRFWNIEDISANLKKIAVTVLWADYYGSHNITLTTIKAR